MGKQYHLGLSHIVARILEKDIAKDVWKFKNRWNWVWSNNINIRINMKINISMNCNKQVVNNSDASIHYI